MKNIHEMIGEKEVIWMPALYAHKCFGTDVRERLSEDLKGILKKYPIPFCIGLQGPDMYFFYRPWTRTHVSTYAEKMHHENADEFFKKAAKEIQKRGRCSREYAYILGFICHFALDSVCHPYVNQMVKRIEVGHMEIEGEFEKFLLRKEGKDALSYPVEKYIPTDEMTVETMSHFFPNISRKEIKESLVTYRLVEKILTAPGRFKQGVINLLLRILGIYKKYYGLMHSYYDNPKCRQTNEELEKKYNQAILVAIELIQGYDDYICNGIPLPERFQRTYD